MEKNYNPKYSHFGMEDKLAYMFGDLANDMTFMLQSMYLMVFYTQVLKIPSAAVGTLFLVARIVDAFTDTGMGRIVDMAPVGKEGKFKPWIRRIAIPVALASFLLYQSGMQGASMTVKMIYMYVTYLLWGSFMYTAINIPYGSMASAITADPDERTELSTWRSRGATLAQLVIGGLVPMIIFTEVNGQQVVKTDMTFPIMAAVFSLLAILFYFFCYKGTVERIKIPSQGTKSAAETLKDYKRVLSNRGLIGIILGSLFLIMAQLMVGSMNNYVFKDIFNTAKGLSIINLVNPIIALLFVQTTAPIVAKKFGKKEVTAGATILGTGMTFILFILNTRNPWVFIVCLLLAYVGMNYFNTIIWANIIDVIDDVEVKTHNRDDGTIYGLYSFARKVGQAFAGAAAGWALAGVGYDQTAISQTPEVIQGMYNISTLVPAIAMALAALAIIFIYPLGKARVKENARELASRRECELNR